VTVTIESLDSAYAVDLAITQETTDVREASAQVISVPGGGPDETIVVDLTGSETVSLSGTASAYELAERPDFSDQPVRYNDNIAQFALEFEAVVNGAQGQGYRLTGLPDGPYEGVVENVSWEMVGGEPHTLGWSLTMQLAEGVGEFSVPQPVGSTTVTGGGFFIDGEVIERVDRKFMERRQQVDIYELALSDPEDNTAVPTGGAIREWTIQGRVNARATHLDDIDAAVRGSMGDGQTVEFYSLFPDRSFDVVITNWETTRRGGEPETTMEYVLEMVEGTA
jgi:hypothetical protein